LSAEQKGGIAGGIVGGAIFLILLALLFVSYRRGRRLRREAEITRTLQSQPSRDMSHSMGSGRLLATAPRDPIPDMSMAAQYARSPTSGPSIPESIEEESTAGPSINYKELAAEIAAHMRQNPSLADSGTSGGLPPVPEVPRMGSSGPESVRGRQLPLPPAATMPQRTTDTRSIDTLPAYAAGQVR